MPTLSKSEYSTIGVVPGNSLIVLIDGRDDVLKLKDVFGVVAPLHHYAITPRKRVVSNADKANSVIDVTATDIYQLTAIANNTTFSTTGTPDDGQDILIRFKDAGVSKTLTWNAVFMVIGVALPAATTPGKWHYVGCQYNATAAKWHVLAVGEQA